MRRLDSREDIDALLARVDQEISIAMRVVGVSVVARRLGVSTTTVRNWILAGRVRAGRTLSGRYRVPISELARIIKAQESQHSKL